MKAAISMKFAEKKLQLILYRLCLKRCTVEIRLEWEVRVRCGTTHLFKAAAIHGDLRETFTFNYCKISPGLELLEVLSCQMLISMLCEKLIGWVEKAKCL